MIHEKFPTSFSITYLDSLRMLNDPETTGLPYSTKLDHKYTSVATYNPLTGKYNFSVPYNRSDVVSTLSDGCYEEDRGSSFSPCLLYTSRCV